MQGATRSPRPFTTCSHFLLQACWQQPYNFGSAHLQSKTNTRAPSTFPAWSPSSLLTIRLMSDLLYPAVYNLSGYLQLVDQCWLASLAHEASDMCTSCSRPCRFKEMILDCRCPRDPITFAQGGLTIRHFGVSVLLFKPLLLNDSAALVMYTMSARQHLVAYNVLSVSLACMMATPDLPGSVHLQSMTNARVPSTFRFWSPSLRHTSTCASTLLGALETSYPSLTGVPYHDDYRYRDGNNRIPLVPCICSQRQT